MVIATRSDNVLQILLRPNRSATWHQNKLVLMAVAAVCLTIATAWSIAGVWMILPFAGIEVALVTYFVYKVSASTYQQEVLYIEPGAIRLERGVRFPLWQRQFDRDNSEFIFTHPHHSLSPASLTLEGPGEPYLLGQFLSQQDMCELSELIRQSGVNYRFRGKSRVTALDVFDY